MIRVAYWSCALLALAHARVYERCELARELRSLGVDQEDISTWVCITYHESRFDTAAQNGWSGDHGLFQISELYWCGPGKACGLPCSALRDEDISDDLECALKIREEHNRLQGDGFLAWVVYPQHCKHNTKKYIVDCDSQLKSAPVRTPSRSRTFNNPYIKNQTTSDYNPNIDNLKPPYLTVNSIVQEGYAKILEDNKKRGPINWLNYKIDNIDDLTLPVFSNQFNGFPRFTTTTTTAAPTTSTTTLPTTTSTNYPPIKVWRRIETNQFRKKLVVDKKPTPAKWLELGKPTNHVDFATSTSVYDLSKSTSAATTARPSTTEVTTFATPVRSILDTFVFTTPTTTKGPTKTPFVFTTTRPTSKQSTTSTGRNINTLDFIAPATTKGSTNKPFLFTTTTARPTSRPFFPNTIITSPKSSLDTFVFTTPATTKGTTNKPFVFTTTTPKPATTNAERQTFFTREYRPFIFTTPSTTTRATELPTTERSTRKTSTSTLKPFIFNNGSIIEKDTEKNDRFKISFASKPEPKTTFNFFQPTSKLSTTESKPWTTFRFSSSTTTRPSTFNVYRTTTIRPSTSASSTTESPAGSPDPFNLSESSRTPRLLSQKDSSKTASSFTSKPFTQRPVTTSTPFKTTAHSAPTKTSQSIFDLYLRPTQWPKLPTRRFPEIRNSAFKLRIFSGGTTPAPQPTLRSRAPPGGAARNQVKRQTSHT